MYLDGKRIKEIVDYLNEKKIRTKFDKPMSINIVQYMLSNRKYIGEFRYRDITIPDGIPALVDKIYSLQSEDNPRLSKLKEQLAETEKKIENILNVIEQCAVLPSVQKRLSELEERKNDVELAILQEEIKKPFLTKEQIAYAFEKFKKLDISTRGSKQMLIDCFINVIYLYDDKVTFIFNYKNGTQTVSLTSFRVRITNCLGAPKKRPFAGRFFWRRTPRGRRPRPDRSFFFYSKVGTSGFAAKYHRRIV